MNDSSLAVLPPPEALTTSIHRPLADLLGLGEDPTGPVERAHTRIAAHHDPSHRSPIRDDLIARTRREIAAGRYLTGWRLELAVDLLIGSIISGNED